MAHTHKFQAEESSDRAALEAALALIPIVAASTQYQLTVQTFGQGLSHPLWTKSADVIRQEYEALLEADINAVEVLTLQPHGHSGLAVTYRRDDSTVTLQWHQGDGVAAVRAARTEFRAVSAPSIRKKWSDEERKYLAQLELATGRLSDVAREALRQTQTFRDGLEADYQAKRQALDAELVAKRQELEVEFQSREQAFSVKEEALKARTAELDNRDAVHARRQLRGDLQDEIKARREKPGLSKGTEDKRRIVHFILAFGLLVLGALYLGYPAPSQAPSSEVDVWFSQVRRVVAGLGFGGLLWFWIRWTSQWFKENAQAEFRIRQLALDFDRASWLVEVTREWADAKVEPPQELIDAMARGLFESGESPEKRRRLGDLASHLERAERVRLKYGENELELGKAALKERGK